MSGSATVWLTPSPSSARVRGSRVPDRSGGRPGKPVERRAVCVDDGIVQERLIPTGRRLPVS